MDEDTKFWGTMIGGLCLAFFCLWFVLATVVFIGPGESAVVFNRYAGMTNKSLNEGINFINPITEKVRKYDLKITKTEFEKIEGLSSDSQTITLNTVVNWRLQPSKIKEVYQTVQGNIADTIMYNAIIDTTKTELGKFRIGEIAQGREKLKAAIETNLRDRLKSQFVDIVNVSVTNVDFSAEYEKSVENKLIAEQQALEAKNQKESVRYQAEAKAIENQNLSATITPLVLKQKLIEKWDGHFPQIMAGGNGAFLMDISSIMGSGKTAQQ